MTTDTAWLTSVNGVRLAQHGRIIFDPSFAAADFGRLLALIREHVGEFAVYDPLYPSPSDPGAYLSYSAEGVKDGVWRMTLGNHGWTGGIFHITETTIIQQLTDLRAQALLDSIGIAHVHFFHHRPMQDSAKSATMDRRIWALHSADGGHAPNTP